MINTSYSTHTKILLALIVLLALLLPAGYASAAQVNIGEKHKDCHKACESHKNAGYCRYLCNHAIDQYFWCRNEAIKVCGDIEKKAECLNKRESCPIELDKAIEKIKKGK